MLGKVSPDKFKSQIRFALNGIDSHDRVIASAFEVPQ